MLGIESRVDLGAGVGDWVAILGSPNNECSGEERDLLHNLPGEFYSWAISLSSCETETGRDQPVNYGLNIVSEA